MLCLAHNYRSLDDVLQFTNIARPGVGLKQIDTLFVHRLKALSCFPCVTIDEVLDQHGNIFSSLPERGDLNGKNVEPVKEVAPEHTLSDGGLQIAVSSRNHPDIGLDGSSSTDTFEFVFLQNMQERDLGLGRELSEFIEEDRAPLGQLTAPQAPLSCPREGALLMAEQFRRNQVAWNCGAVNTDKRSRATL